MIQPPKMLKNTFRGIVAYKSVADKKSISGAIVNQLNWDTILSILEARNLGGYINS